MIEPVFIALMRILTGAVARSHGFTFEPEKQRIYYANHTSHLDTVLLWSMVPKAQRSRVHPAAAKDYWWSSRLRTYLAERVFHAVPVVRQRESATDNPIAALHEVLAKGESLILFPEGTRGDGSAVQPFKSGLYHLVAAHPQVELVPVYIQNLNRVMPKGGLLPVPIFCTLQYGAPFTLAAGESKADFIQRAQKSLEELMPC